MRTIRSTFIAVALVGGVSVAGAGITRDVDVGPDLEFIPQDLVIEVGDTVRWTWIGGFHNVESGVNAVHDGIFRSGDPTSDVGTVFEVTFDEQFLLDNPVSDDVYDYYCIVHVGLDMVGSIEVVTCPGDLDGNGQVDLNDLTLLLSNYGTSEGAGYFDGDLDGDGSVRLSDLTSLLSVYGTSCE
jgi:plastocyanin